MRPSLGALIGPGRSGTTWAGALVNSNPHVLYRFEPFNRMAMVDSGYQDWLQRLKANEVSQDDIPALIKLLVKSHPLIDKDPFFAKSFCQRTFCRRPLWLAARLAPALGRLYQTLYTPSSAKHLIFKEVTFVKPLQGLLRRTNLPVIYLVRHPCATVMSDVHGQQSGKMPSRRQENLHQILLEHDPALAENFPEVWTGTDLVERTALLWRCEVEACLREAAMYPKRMMLMTYEQLAEDAHSGIRAMLKHYNVPFDAQTDDFVEQLYNESDNPEASPRRTGWGDRYFSVFRNPRKQKDAWKAKISLDDRSKIERMMVGSSLIQQCAVMGNWD